MSSRGSPPIRFATGFALAVGLIALYRGQPVATHRRQDGARRFITDPGHRPERHRAVIELNHERLLERADVLVENFRPGTLEKWGLGYEALAEINPGLESSDPSGLTPYNGFIYFGADDGTTGQELWRTNGTTTERLVLRRFVAEDLEMLSAIHGV